MKPFLKKVLDKRFKDVISSGQSVICDYQHNFKAQRDYVYRLAEEVNALSLAVWVQTPVELIIERGATRTESADSVRTPRSGMRQMIENNLSKFEPPEYNEPNIKA